MNERRHQHDAGFSRTTSTLCLVVGLLGALAASCSSGSSAKGGNNPAGTVLEHPDGSGIFVVDPNNAGLATRLRLVNTMWGRLVDVFSVEADGSLQPHNTEVVVGDDIETDNLDYVLARNPVTAKENLAILHPADSPEFLDAFKRLDQNLTPIFDNGLGGAGVFSMVPRNAVIVLQFDDLLNPNLVSNETIHIFTGVPSVLPFESRIFIDHNHGDLADYTGGPEAEFYSTRIIIDTTVTELEQLEWPFQIDVNGVGLPGSINVNLSNTAVRIPTREDPVSLQETILRNPTGHGLAVNNNGSIDYGSSTEDVVRLMRAGGNGEVTGDPFNGFLRDEASPLIIGAQQVGFEGVPFDVDGSGTIDPDEQSVTVAPDPAFAGIDETRFLVKQLRFASEFCAHDLAAGDVITQTGIFAEVGGLVPANAGVALDVPVRLLLYPTEWDLLPEPNNGPLQWMVVAGGSAGQFQSPYQPSQNTSQETCFVQILPTPGGFPAQPAAGLETNATIALSFSEPMDPASMTAFDSMTLTRRSTDIGPLDEPLRSSDYVVGKVQQSPDLLKFTFLPDLPLAHSDTFGPFGATEEPYFLKLESGADGPTDLAGNPVTFSLPEIVCTIDKDAPTVINGGRVSRFTGQDEEPPFGDAISGPLPEWTGQHLYDQQRELIRPRPVIHFQAVVDRSQLVPQLMTPIASGVQTPLSALGSKMQTLWRYVDAGFALTDVTNYDIDIEGLNWAPVAEQADSDTFEEFEIRLAHSKWLPDEYIDPASLFPLWFQSGLKETFANNVLTGSSFDVVHPKDLGYTINPGDLFQASSGTVLMPFPMNRTISANEFRYYTWRDTRVRNRAGKNNGGVELWQSRQVLGLTLPPCIGMPGATLQLYGKREVPTVALPLLMEFRCYPDDGALGINSFDISIASNSSSRPYFRAWSTGGTDQGGVTHNIDPDIEETANGGFNPTSTPPGATLPGLDNVVYMGAMDLVVRVSHSYSVWFEALGPIDPASGNPITIGQPIFQRPVVEPRDEDQPLGTELLFAFRGASSVGPLDPQTDANTIDGYGDYYDNNIFPPPACGKGTHDREFANPNITFLNDDDKWFEYPEPGATGDNAIFEVDGARYYQVRATYIANPVTGLVPELSAFALSWLDD